MLDEANTYFFGVATDTPSGPKKPEQPHHAVGDIAYYYEPGDRMGKIGTVNGYWRDDNGRIMIDFTITATGENISAPQSRIRD